MDGQQVDRAWAQVELPSSTLPGPAHTRGGEDPLCQAGNCRPP